MTNEDASYHGYGGGHRTLRLIPFHPCTLPRDVIGHALICERVLAVVGSVGAVIVRAAEAVRIALLKKQGWA